MVFDVISFLAGIAAGGLTGALAAILYGLEKTADLQERLRRVSREVESINTNLSSNDAKDPNSRTRLNEVRRELEEIHEEIRQMYKKSTH
jgi:peptidoglycan hydrolase CwlO-like protein